MIEIGKDYIEMYSLIFTGVNLVIMFMLMILQLDPVYVLLSINVSLYFGGILSIDNIIKGFSNQSILTVLVLFPIVQPIINSLTVNELIRRFLIFGNQNFRIILAKIMIPVFIISAFINNTPVTIIYLNFIQKWCQHNQDNSYQYLLPMAYSCIMGGTCTLIGTSTNLLANGIIGQWGLTFGFFDFAKITIIPSVISILILLLVTQYLLPNYVPIAPKNPTETLFRCQIRIPENSSLIGLNIHNWTSSYIEGIKKYLTDRWITVADNMLVEPNDQLQLYGSIQDLINFVLEYHNKINFLSMSEINKEQLVARLAETINCSPVDLAARMIGDTQFYKVVPSVYCQANLYQIGDKVFEQTYLALVAGLSDSLSKTNLINGTDCLDDVIINNGICLLLYGTTDFLEKYANSDHFVSITRYQSTKIKKNIFDNPFVLTLSYKPLARFRFQICRHLQNWHISVLLFIIMIVLNIANLLPILVTAVASLLIQVGLGIIDTESIYQSLDWHIYFILALSYGIGSSVISSGLDVQIGNLISLVNYHPILILFTIGFITLIITNLIHHSVSVSIMLPLAHQITLKNNYHPEALLLYVTCLASISFLTNFAYQVCTIIQKPGNYQLLDYMKSGLIPTISYYILLTMMVYLLYLI